MQNTVPKPKVPSAIWTQAHLRELEQAFPEITAPGNSEAINHSRGTRRVVHWVRERTRGGADNGAVQ